MIKLDDYIIDRVQGIYDFVWDHFGITKGMIMMLVKFTCAFIVFFSTIATFWKIFWCIFFIHSAYKSYTVSHVFQTQGNYKKINKIALEARGREAQKTKLYIMFPLIMICIGYNFSIQNFSISFMFFIILLSYYLLTVLIRDREPKDFFANPQLDY